VTVWRISNHRTLDGGGGLRASGRWHTRGRRIVYCAPNPATALLEVMARAEIDFEDLPVTLRYLEIELPDSTASETAEVSALGVRWASRIQKTREIGDDWLRSGRTALLIVPCALVPATTNIVINPAHPDTGRIHIAAIHAQAVDPRLVG